MCPKIAPWATLRWPSLAGQMCVRRIFGRYCCAMKKRPSPSVALRERLVRAIRFGASQALGDERSLTWVEHLRSEQWLSYLSLSEMGRRGALDGDPSLTRFELRVLSQNGEDGVLAEIIRRVNPPHTFIEFGAENGAEGNCVLLADVLGWQGLFIEADEQMFAELAEKYLANPGVRTCQAIVTPSSIEPILLEAGVPAEIGVLSVDIDGNDLWVWEGLRRWTPWIVVIEYNSSLRGNQVQEYSTQGWDRSAFFGASLEALEILGASKGYSLVHTDLTGANAFFVRDDHCVGLPAGEDVARRPMNLYLRRFRHPPSTDERRQYREYVVPEG